MKADLLILFPSFEQISLPIAENASGPELTVRPGVDQITGSAGSPPCRIRDGPENGIVPQDGEFLTVRRDRQSAVSFNAPAAVFQGDQRDHAAVTEGIRVDCSVHRSKDLDIGSRTLFSDIKPAAGGLIVRTVISGTPGDVTLQQ